MKVIFSPTRTALSAFAPHMVSNLKLYILLYCILYAIATDSRERICNIFDIKLVLDKFPTFLFEA